MRACNSIVSVEMAANVDNMLEAALRWLSENPMVPSEHQAWEILTALPDNRIASTAQLQTEIGEWQRRMFLAPELEVPKWIEEVIFIHDFVIEDDALYRKVKEKLRAVCREAYRRGKESR